MDSQTSVIVGNYVLIGCCAVYLVWWSIAFNPRFSPSLAPKVILFLVPLVLGVVIVVMAIIGMVCYLWYCRLNEMPAFFIGMVPLVLFAISMLTTNLLAR